MYVVPWAHDAPNVTSPAWHPFFLTDMTMSATPDLVSIIHGLQEVQQHTRHRLPISVDENIHCCVLTLVYSINYAQCNLPLFLTRTPVVYGTWHPYKYCITLFYRRFFALFTYFFLFTKFGSRIAQFSETHLYGVYDSCSLALGAQVASTFGTEVKDPQRVA